MNDIINKIEKELAIGSNVMSEQEFRATMIAISSVAAEIVSKTLGPYGASTVIDNGTGALYSTKDGLHTLENIRFNDPIYNALFRLLIQPSFKSSHTVGDSTTTATVVVNEFIKAINHTFLENSERYPAINQRKIIEAVKWVTDKIVDRINSSSDLVEIDKDGDFNDIYDVAMTSSNGDERLSAAIKEIYSQTHNPDIYLDMNHHSDRSYNITRGYRFDCNPLNLLEMCNSDDGSFKCSETKSLCYFFDHNVTYQEHISIIQGISADAVARNTMAIIFAPGFDSILCEIVGSMVQSMRTQNKIPYIMLVQIPYVSRIHKSVLQDLRYITNTQIFDYARVKCYRVLVAKAKGENIESKLEDNLYGIEGYGYTNTNEILDECAGTVNNITIHSNFAVIKDYDAISNRAYFKTYVGEVKKEFESLKSKTSHYEIELSKEYLDAQMHYIRLSGDMGTIYVEGDSIQERRMKYDTAEDVVFACKSAYLNGVVRGTCFTTIYEINKLLQELNVEYDAYVCMSKSECIDMQLRMDVLSILKDSFIEVASRIFRNKYLDGKIDSADLTFKDTDFSSDKFRGENGIVGVYDIIETCSYNGLTFDLHTDTIRGANHTVLNPVNSDTGIIKSICSMITAILTSKQLISINRQYDKMTNRINVERDKREQLKKEFTIKADAVVSAIADKLLKH